MVSFELYTRGGLRPQKMVDRAIKVSVLEAPIIFSQLKLKEAMWTAKFTSGGFSVNFFWPTSWSFFVSAPKCRDIVLEA